MLDTRGKHELLLPVTEAFAAAQMSEELVWELFVQGGPIGETRVTTMMSILQCLVLPCITALAVQVY
jgi:hypothetical protein